MESIIEICQAGFSNSKEIYIMPTIINGQTYYRTREVCRIAGIGRSTLLRWLRSGILEDVSHRDRRGWRLFTEADIKRTKNEANKIK